MSFAAAVLFVAFVPEVLRFAVLAGFMAVTALCNEARPAKKKGDRIMKLGVFLSLSVVLASSTARADTLDELAQQVRAAETAFARSMADRSLDAFAALLAEDAVFFGRDQATHGKEAVVASWKPLFEGKDAPFSWESAQVEVADSGTLAHSSGPVYDATGKRVGTFNSIWRREADGTWKVVFDKGCDACECAAAQ